MPHYIFDVEIDSCISHGAVAVGFSCSFNGGGSILACGKFESDMCTIHEFYCSKKCGVEIVRKINDDSDDDSVMFV